MAMQTILHPETRPIGLNSTLGLAAMWFVASLVAVIAGVFDPGVGALPLPTMVAVALPVTLFLVGYASSARLRAAVLGWDPRLLVAAQAWRVLGLMFVGLYAYDALPALFAFPAGLGDAAVGLTAPLVLVMLLRRPESRREGWFVAWNWLGILDFAGALGTGILASGALPALVGAGPTSAPMGVWPLALIPAFWVPVFIILHLAALLQAHAARKAVA
ncbi:MAG: hypothetical protein HOH66_08050 [Rhodospirillaceae bacterium]|nr:hypothetical protein [Rhodospirillaceae bacterium]MBT6117806.1 hypothetical protein [Rhodospirillaceae bacterium]